MTPPPLAEILPESFPSVLDAALGERMSQSGGLNPVRQIGL